MLCTKKEILAFLRNPDNKDDYRIGQIQDGIEKFFKTETGRDIEQATYTEYYNGQGISKKLILNQYPIISVTSLNDDVDRAYGAGTLIASTDYVIWNNEGIVELDDLFFSSGIQNIKIVYVAGYATIPSDIKLCIMRLVEKVYQSAGVSLNNPDMLDIALKTLALQDSEVMKIIDKYRRIDKGNF